MADRFAELCRQRAKTQARLDSARQVLAERSATYNSTSDGLAEALRAWEVSGNEPPDTRKELQTIYLQGERDSVSEYRARVATWGAQSNDGPMRAIPCGDDADLTPLLLRHRLLGTFRVCPDPEQITRITLLRIDDNGGRHRRTFSYGRHINQAQADHLTLAGVLRDLMRVNVNDDRLLALLGETTPHFLPALA